MDATTLIAICASILGIASTLYAWRRKEEAAVKLKELDVARSKIDNTTDHIASADKLVDLIEKTNEKVLARQAEYYEKIIQQQTKNYEKLLAKMGRLERAFKNIDSCRYKHQCPVLDELPGGQDDSEQPSVAAIGHGDGCRDPA